MRNAILHRTLVLLALSSILTVVFADLPSIAAGRLMLFSDDGEPRFLGCLNCDRFASNSVHNQYGQYGSPYATDSIWNQYGRYGSPYSSYSPCNPNAASPPVVLDADWAFQGRLTLNSRHPKAIQDNEIVSWLRFGVCRRP